VLGFLIEFLAYRPLRDQPRINSLITAIGVSLFLEYGGQKLFGADPKAFPQLVPGIESAPDLFHIGQLVIGKVDAIILVVTFLLMAGLRYIVLHTKTGMAMR